MTNFNKDECNEIIELSKILKGTRRDEYPRKIKYTFYSIPYEEKYHWIFDRLNQYFTETTGIEVVGNLEALHLFDYEKGDQFKRHKDVYYDGQIHNIGVCLNDDYEGGDFKLYKPEVTLPKQRGEIYTFPCHREHEVLEVIEGHRWSLIGFYFYKHLNITPPTI